MTKSEKMEDKLAVEIGKLLKEREEKVIFAESCTAGNLSSTLGQVPGISSHLCGSAVTYRPTLKMKWLGVKLKTIAKHTTESQQVAAEMAVGVIKKCAEANWSVSIVGHMGPNSPPDKDGHIYVCYVRRTKKGNIKIKDCLEYQCKTTSRSSRIKEATEAVFTQFVRLLSNKSRKDKATEVLETT